MNLSTERQKFELKNLTLSIGDFCVAKDSAPSPSRNEADCIAADPAPQHAKAVPMLQAWLHVPLIL
jgi:hypothetical protein